MKVNFTRSCTAVLAVVVLGCSALYSRAASAAEPVKLAIAVWATGKAVGNIAKYVMETQLQQPVEVVTTDIGIQFEGIARGDVDLMVNGWLPMTHEAYYAKYKDRIVDQGVIFNGGKNGWAVPAYVPESEVSSFEDLNKPEVRQKMKGTINGIDPGSGLMRASEKATKAYGLQDYTLQASSEAGMLASLSRAYQSKQWIVATVWSPHWLFQKWPMRYLKDSRQAMGGEEQVHAFSSKSFPAKFPRAANFAKNFRLTVADVEAVSLDGNAMNDYAAAAKKFVDSHPEKLKAWLQQ